MLKAEQERLMALQLLKGSLEEAVGCLQRIESGYVSPTTPTILLKDELGRFSEAIEGLEFVLPKLDPATFAKVFEEERQRRYVRKRSRRLYMKR
ncbi:hypothetical protein ACN4EG_25250 [Alkalinema pantanalense CENA528]|uniref:hypothetical protein n=1 Tax=Alkalinema pantanalense TaxID=1620705 RepID=UPI003D6E83A3